MVEKLNLALTSIVSTNYEFSSSIPNDLKGICFTIKKLSKARFIYPFCIPILATLSKDQTIIKLYKEYENSFSTHDILDGLNVALEHAKKYSNIDVAQIYLDDKLIPVAIKSKNGVVFSVVPDNYFDTAEFLIAPHLSRTIAKMGGQYNTYGLLRLGDNTLVGFTYYLFHNLVIPYILSTFYSRYGEPQDKKYNISRETFRLLVALYNSHLGYDRCYEYLTDPAYDMLVDSSSIPTINIEDEPGYIRAHALTKKSNKLRTMFNDILNAKNTSLSTVVDIDTPTYDISFIYTIYASSDKALKDVYAKWSLHDFLSLGEVSPESLDDLGSDIIFLTPDSPLMIGDDLRIILDTRYIEFGAYTSGRFILVFGDDIHNSVYFPELENHLHNDKQFEPFDSIEIYTLSDIELELRNKAFGLKEEQL